MCVYISYSVIHVYVIKSPYKVELKKSNVII